LFGLRIITQTVANGAGNVVNQEAKYFLFNEERENKVLLIIICGIGWIIYFLKYKSISPPTAIILKNAKYTVGEITSVYYGDRARKKGNNFTFSYKEGVIRNAHQEGEFIYGENILLFMIM